MDQDSPSAFSFASAEASFYNDEWLKSRNSVVTADFDIGDSVESLYSSMLTWSFGTSLQRTLRFLDC